MLEIVPAKKSDAELILQYIRALAEVENFPFPVSVSRADLEVGLFGESPAAVALMRELR